MDRRTFLKTVAAAALLPKNPDRPNKHENIEFAPELGYREMWCRKPGASSEREKMNVVGIKIPVKSLEGENRKVTIYTIVVDEEGTRVRTPINNKNPNDPSAYVREVGDDNGDVFIPVVPEGTEVPLNDGNFYDVFSATLSDNSTGEVEIEVFTSTQKTILGKNGKLRVEEVKSNIWEGRFQDINAEISHLKPTNLTQ